jgi:hypothetical protein
MGILHKVAKGIRYPSRVFRIYYRGVDFWPPSDFRRHYRIKFYLLELPARWIFGGVFPQRWDGKTFSTFFNEHKFIEHFLDSTNLKPKFFVDIGAGDGISMSNTFQLAHSGVSGLAIEGSPVRFAQLSLTYEKLKQVQLVRTYASSATISSILKGCDVPKEFDILNLDIDSYDLHILSAILKDFHPKLCVIEWNRSYPPSVYYSVNNDPTIRWDDYTQIFPGASLRAFEELCFKHEYKLIAVQGAALFAVPNDSLLNAAPKSANELWSEYLNGPPKWIETDLELCKKSHHEVVAEFNSRLIKFNGMYEIR